MMKEEHVNIILDNCPVRLFQSSSHDSARIDWPWRMFPPKEATPRYVDASDVFAIDSQPQSPSLDNQQVLDCAADLGADIVLLVDYFPFDVYRQNDGPLFDKNGDLRPGREADLEAFEKLTAKYDSAYEASIDSVRRGLDLVDDHDFDGEVWVPLQSPHVDSWERLDRPQKVAIGGLKDAPGYEKVQAARELRAATGPDVYIHGLGYGPCPRVTEAIRDDPDLLDSVDSKRAGASSIKGQDIWPGDEMSTPLAAYVLADLLESCRRMAGFGTNPDGEATYLDQYGD